MSRPADPSSGTVLVRRSPAVRPDGLRVYVGTDPASVGLARPALRVTVGATVATSLGLPPGGWRTTVAELPRWFGVAVDAAPLGEVVTAPERPAGEPLPRVAQKVSKARRGHVRRTVRG